jgi:hypothetical protein
MAENRFAKAARARAASLTAARRQEIAAAAHAARGASRAQLKRWGRLGAKARWGKTDEEGAA